MKQFKLAVIGNPIAHSLSPKLFVIFAEQCGIQLTFDKILTTVDNFSGVIDDFFHNGGKALAVTSPFKQLAYKYAKYVSDNALPCKSANLLYIGLDNNIIADNTDGRGLVKDIVERLKINLIGADLLILGAGGVVSAIIPALIRSGVASISINARDTSKIIEIQCKFPQVRIFNINFQYTGIINTTPNLLENELFDCKYNISQFVYDMSYFEEKTICIQKIMAQHHDLRYSNGLGMLVMQAYFSFQLVFNQSPDVVNAYAKLKNIK